MYVSQAASSSIAVFGGKLRFTGKVYDGSMAASRPYRNKLVICTQTEVRA